MGLNQRILVQDELNLYTNTLVIVNQPWVELPDNPFSQPKIKEGWRINLVEFNFSIQVRKSKNGTNPISAVKDKER